MRALVLGLGISGKSACEILRRRGVEVIAIDDSLSPKEVPIEDFDLFVPSPGIPQKHPLYVRAKAANIPIKGETQLFFEETTQPGIAVTGTNGKTTLVKLLAHALEAKAVGNVGFPMCDAPKDQLLIVELSSYQLETLSAKVFDIGVILNITEDHLDRYENLEAYAKAKAQLENCVKDEGILYVHESIDPSRFSRPIVRFADDEIATLICNRLGKGLDRITTFVKPPHRIEFVSTVNGIPYYNDSKATNVGAVLYALKKIPQNVVLLLGGKDKNLSFEPLLEMRSKFSSVIAFGEAREKIANALQLIEVHLAETVQDAVAIAEKVAKPTDVVLFSPGCASFDAFKNYEERGEFFKKLVLRRS